MGKREVRKDSEHGVQVRKDSWWNRALHLLNQLQRLIRNMQSGSLSTGEGWGSKLNSAVQKTGMARMWCDRRVSRHDLWQGNGTVKVRLKYS